jgi:hypothetical protein
MERLIRYFYREVQRTSADLREAISTSFTPRVGEYVFYVYGTTTYRNGARNFLNISITNISVQGNS